MDQFRGSFEPLGLHVEPPCIHTRKSLFNTKYEVYMQGLVRNQFLAGIFSRTKMKFYETHFSRTPWASCGAAMYTHTKSLFNTKYKILTKQSICARV